MWKSTRLWILVIGSLAASAAADQGSSKAPWTKLPIRDWQDYPFVQPPDRAMRTQLWQDFSDLPEWLQRGNIFYFADSTSEAAVDRAAAVKGLIHVGAIRQLTPQALEYMKAKDVPLILRLDGQYFWGRDYMNMMEALRGGGWAEYHNTVPNSRWYEKFPPSLEATKIRRDGELIIEYYGSAWVQRRDISFMHPAAIQMRDGFLRECVLGENVFGIELDLKTGGYPSGVWWDNPGNVVVSYDPYSTAYVAKRFAEKFGTKYPDPIKHKPFYGDPPYFWITYHDPEVRDWYEQLWADAYAGYYAWQYRFLQKEVAPKLNKKHLFVGGNSKLNWSTANWDYYLFSWPDVYDVLGPNETTPIYTDKEAPGMKLALAASNGKPAGLWKRQSHPGAIGEALTCLAVTHASGGGELTTFQNVNRDLYHNAQPGGRLAVLYHLLDGLHHSEIANLARVCDQAWRAGAALEVITELHLSPQVLKQFDVLMVPGWRFSDAELAALKTYVTGGGKLLLIGDNRDSSGKQLSEVLAGIAEFTDGQAPLGKGIIRNYGTQLITQKQMAEALDTLGALADWRIVSPVDQNLMLNILTQPKKNLVEAHVVNFTNAPMKDVTVQLPRDLNARFVAMITPRGGNAALEVKDNRIVLPALQGYAVAVICPDAATRDEILKNNEVIKTVPVPEKLEGRMYASKIAPVQMEPERLAPGQRVAHFRQSGRAGFRRLDADIVMADKGNVGQDQDIKLAIHAVGVWSPTSEHLDQIKYVMINTATGERYEVPVEMETVRGEAGGENVRDKTDVTLPAGSFIQRKTTTSWTPTKPGRYQVYLGYRYYSEVYDGKGDKSDKSDKKYDRDNYMFGRPLLKLSYEERLPCMIVDVAE